jgi:hypothetical protein
MAPVHFTVVILEIGSHKIFAWDGAMILLLSVSHVAMITGMSYQIPDICGPF